MNPTDKSQIWFTVVNVYAASTKAAESWTLAEGMMKEKGIIYHGTFTGKAGNAMEVTFDACMAGYRKFVAVGGDGTVHDVLNGIAHFVEWKKQEGASVSLSDFVLGVIPVGSGNDWIKTTGIPNDIEKAVSALQNGVCRAQDVVKAAMLDLDALPQEKEIAVSYMINIGGVGLDARVCTMVNAKKQQGKRGKILYVTSLMQAIAERKPALAKVICDDKVIFDGPYLSLALGVGKYSGGGMRQTPEAILDDGLLDITIIPEIAFSRIACEAWRLFTGSFLKIPELTYSRAKTIYVMPDTNSSLEPVEVDGEVVGKLPVRFDVLDNQINILVVG